MTRQRTPLEGQRRPRSRRNGRARFLLGCTGVLVLALVVLLGGAWVLLYGSQTDAPPGRAVQFEVPKGSSTAAIADILVDAGVISNANMFRLQARLADADAGLKAGVYDLTTGMSYNDAIAELTRGPEIIYSTVTIPEGFVIDLIAERLEAQANIPASEFLALARTGGAREFPDYPYLAAGYQGSLEGYLFPKTYRIKEGATAREVIEMMLDQFDREMTAVNLAPAESRGMSLHEIITLASMIEREAQVADEQVLVSSVIHNRVEKGMRLEIDATIEYILPGNRFRLQNSDLKIDSPYNSYMYAGLPPGPIASPGLGAIQAAVNPAETDYIYYVLTDPDGSHTFTETWEEFLVAKRKSKEVFGK